MKAVNDIVHIVFAVDNNYVQHLGVTLISLFENNKENTFHIFIITYEPELKDQASLEKIIFNYQHTVQFLYFNKRQVTDLPVSKHISHATYIRCFLHEIIPESINKILYLDCDLIILEDIRPLWDTEIHNFAIGAVRDPVFFRNQKKVQFNAGVMLVNLPFWREKDFSLSIRNILKNGELDFKNWDQSILNALIGSKWQKLDEKYNVQREYFRSSPKGLGLTKDFLKEIIQEPVIIHFTTDSKPWQYMFRHPYKKYY